MNREEMLHKMENVFFDLGFKSQVVGKKQYEYLYYNSCYCKITYLETLSAFVIESADNVEDAMNGVLEDGDLYFLDIPEEKLLSQLAKNIKMDYMK